MDGKPAEDMPAGIEFGAAARPLWLLDPDIAHLNHGSFGATPRAVLDAQSAWRERMERSPVRFMTELHDGLLRHAAESLADYLGASGADLVLLENATSGVNTILRSLVFQPGDEIVTTDHVYPAVRLSVEEICGRQGAKLIEAPLPFPTHDADTVIDAITLALTARTKLVTIDHVTSPTALVMPVERIAVLCAERGIPLLVDGAHAPGMLPLDLPSIGADWYVGNCHKWFCAPKGCGFLWAKPERQAALHPLIVSHSYRHGFTAAFDWTGTRDLTACLSISAAIDFRRRFGEERLRRHNIDLADAAARRLAESWRGEIGAGTGLRGAMVTIKLPGTGDRATLAEAERIHDRLFDEWRIEVPVLPFAGSLWVRISSFAYNDMMDYDRLAAAIADGAARP